ncbi:hypothetical protein JIN77_08805 [Verrucomicrobiaceae bacterium R5-34]|nr:hypothetical protein [Verrucomicrobiaceae bacterium R5-34]
MKSLIIRAFFIYVIFMPSSVSAEFDANELNRNYQKLYYEILSTGPIELKVTSIPEKYNKNVRHKIFYTAGYYRGILDYSSYEGFKKSKGIGVFHNTLSGMNHVEFEGWLLGCKVGMKQGKLVEAKILEAYLKKLTNKKVKK